MGVGGKGETLSVFQVGKRPALHPGPQTMGDRSVTSAGGAERSDACIARRTREVTSPSAA